MAERIKIEIFVASGCSKCGRAKQLLTRMVNDIGSNRFSWREINILREMDYAIDLGVLSTPAIAINGKLVFTALPSVKQLQQTLQSYSVETDHT